MCIMYHQKSFLYDLTRPSLGWCDIMRCLKLFLKKGVSRSSLLTNLKVKTKRKLLLVDDGGNNEGCFKTHDATDNRTFGLVNTNDDYSNGRTEYQTQKCRTLTIFNNNNNNNNNGYYNSKNNVNNNFKGNHLHFFISRL